MGIVYIVKNKLDSGKASDNEKILEHANESFCSGSFKYYNSKQEDGKKLFELKKNMNTNGIIMFISYKGKGNVESSDFSTSEIASIFIGEADIVEDIKYKGTCNVKYKMQKYITSTPVIINLLDDLELDLGNDFDINSYVVVNNSKRIYSMLKQLLLKKAVASKRNDYDDLKEVYSLEEYAQHNKDCVRMYGFSEPDTNRNEFQRDRERIVNSKAFRRLVDKAQIFSAQKGDHYRTRMTHTLEVNQIAKAISVAINLNMDLTEAIALGHDLGHTPFGHQGERTLKEILYGEKLPNLFHIDPSLFDKKLMGGFKHNFQSIRVLTKIEEKYIDFPGLDISMQTLEGILKHTKLKDAELDNFIDKNFIKDLHIDIPFATSLEGQVVAVADEIAQRGHDIDDAITSGLITIEDLIESLNINKFRDLYNILCGQKNLIDNGMRHYVSEKELIVARIISSIIGFFIQDVIDNSKKNIVKYTSCASKKYFDNRLIDFSPDKGKAACEFLEKVVNKKAIGNSEVACFDYNADIIIEKLFESYYRNPKLLHEGTLRKIYVDQVLHEDSRISNTAIDYINGNLDVIRYEIDRVTNSVVPNTKMSPDDNYEILEKRKILVRNIVDYIAGMTDSYAINEYERIK